MDSLPGHAFYRSLYYLPLLYNVHVFIDIIYIEPNQAK